MRYVVIPESQSGHCCFDYTIVDTERPQLINGMRYNKQCAPVCECFEEEDALLICAALNAAC